MADLTGAPAELEYVDRLIDQVVADPARGDDVKTLLKHKMSDAEAFALVEKQSQSVHGDDDVEDLWDNVPV